jgi:hypothetical protein
MHPSTLAYLQHLDTSKIKYADDDLKTLLDLIDAKGIVYPPNYVDLIVAQARKEGHPLFPYDKLLHKRAHIKGWNHQHSTNEAQLRRWFGWWPFAYVCRTEPLGGMGVDVDVNHENGFNGDVVLQSLFAFRPELAPVFKTTQLDRSPRGGWHYEFWNPNAFQFKSVAGWWPGVDIKNGGTGMMFVPPSPGYTAERDVPRLDIPPAFWDLFEVRGMERQFERNKRNEAHRLQEALNIGAGMPRAAAKAAAVSATGLKDGEGRRDFLLRELCRLRHHNDFSVDTLYYAAYDVQSTYFAEPKNDADIRAMVLDVIERYPSSHVPQPTLREELERIWKFNPIFSERTMISAAHDWTAANAEQSDLATEGEVPHATV